MRRTAAEAARFSAAYRATNADVLAFLLRRCATPEDAADCLAETYAVAWRERDRLPSGDDLRPWLFGVARNLMRQGHQRQDRLATAASRLAESLESVQSTHSEPDDERCRCLRAALAELSPADREIITMLAWDQLKPGEIGTILGLSANVVRVRAHRARSRLRSSLSSTDLHSETTRPATQ